MSFHIATQILQKNALFSGKIYKTGENWRLPVATVVTNFKFWGRGQVYMGHQKLHFL